MSKSKMIRWTKEALAKFVCAWQNSTGVPAVAKLFDITTRQATSIANRLRRMGIPLKRQHHKWSPISDPSLIAELRRLCNDKEGSESC